MKVSVIVPVFRVEKWIEACYESLKSQTFRDFEALFVDDCSDDGSRGILESLIERDSSGDMFKILTHERNAGLSAARNTGVRAASGEYLFFLDSDDYLFPYSLEKLVALTEKYPGVDVVQGNCRPDDKDLKWLDFSELGFPEYSSDREWIYTKCLRAKYGSGIPVTVWNKLIRRDLFIRENMWFKEGIWHEDEHWRFTNSMKIGSIAFCTSLTYFYNIHPGSFMGKSKSSDLSPLTRLAIYEECLPALPILNNENIEDVSIYLSWARKAHHLHRRLKYNWKCLKMLLKMAFGQNNFTPRLRIVCIYLCLPPFLVSRKTARKIALGRAR
ncbi:MAG: glycosyltransferase family 2 protein [Bacteroidales bacterium]|nr:glycosyltransferase family 2 protein [Bacteroidales bacterium]